MISIVRTDSENPDFRKLVSELDKELWATYGDVQADYAPHNVIKTTLPAVVVYENNIPVGCGCFKNFDDKSVEIKRMFTLNEHRGKGIAAKVLAGLEAWAKEKKFNYAVLETGTLQHAAIYLYRKLGYSDIEKYEPYTDKEHSICMRKKLI
ncbi:MAG: GNAT family N-acetyltransferase [Bacteroidetes bacterium]|nr:GNAT family N-acetyltransferase [Bacteroidota bacterium]